MTETVAAIVAAHRTRTMTPAQTVARSYQRIREHNDPAIFISLRDEQEALAEAAQLLVDREVGALPLLGLGVGLGPLGGRLGGTAQLAANTAGNGSIGTLNRF